MDTTLEAPAPAPADADPATGPSLVFHRRETAHSIPEDILGILTGTFAVALGLTFLRAAEAVTGGTAGLALLIDYATTLPFWVIYAAVNLPFAILAIWKKGWDFTIRTVVSIALVSGFTVLNQWALPLPDLNIFYGTIAGSLLAGIGLLILFRHRSSLGGINIIALLIQERTGFRAGWTQMIFDVIIVVAALLVVPWQNVLVSALGAVLLNLVLALNHRPGRYIGH